MTIQMAGLDGGTVAVKESELQTLADRLDGSVLTPADAGFDDAVVIWNAMISKRPAVVVQPISAADVRETIRLSRDKGLLLSIKSGGHNIAGTSLADGGLTVDMSRMRAVDVDVERRVARVGAGCLLGEVDRATQAHGLATVLGTVSETGVAGLTLGGGFGYLTRRFGWTVDNLEEVEIVTADGEIRRSAADENEDLFWALRGGGGNFGIVTRFTYRLHEVGPEITGGLILWDAARADDVLALYRNVTEAAPRELTLMLVMRPAPPLPAVPEAWHGRAVVGIIACHTGSAAQAEQDLAPIRAFVKPIVDTFAQKSYVDMQSMTDRTQPNGMHNYWKSEFLPLLSPEVLRECRAHAAAIESPMSQVIALHLGGAFAELDPDSVSAGNRDAAYVFFAAGCWAPDSPNQEEHRAWVRSTWESIRPYATGGSYINAQTADEDAARTQDSYGKNVDRLAYIKALYDPANLFRVNRNITPKSPQVGQLSR